MLKNVFTPSLVVMFSFSSLTHAEVIKENLMFQSIGQWIAPCEVDTNTKKCAIDPNTGKESESLTGTFGNYWINKDNNGNELLLDTKNLIISARVSLGHAIDDNNKPVNEIKSCDVSAILFDKNKNHINEAGIYSTGEVADNDPEQYVLTAKADNWPGDSKDEAKKLLNADTMYRITWKFTDSFVEMTIRNDISNRLIGKRLTSKHNDNYRVGNSVQVGIQRQCYWNKEFPPTQSFHINSKLDTVSVKYQ